MIIILFSGGVCVFMLFIYGGPPQTCKRRPRGGFACGF